MSKRLHLSDDFSLPAEAITQTFGILAVRGSGKSNTAAVMAEEMARLSLPFVVIDPVGNWYGLRSSRDGKKAGLSIPIFGGRHGDVPLEKTGGQLVADLVVNERLSCVLDTSEFSEGDKIRFLIDFAERLYRKNEAPLHLFLEEADDYAPQKPMRDEARMLRAWENVVKRGRARGLGITMITQRSAAINKNLLVQIETLIILRTTSPQDRKAIEAWVDYQGEDRGIVGSLPSLQNGEAWVCSPSWLRVKKRIRVLRRSTFDSAATPKMTSGHRPAATLADVDLEVIKGQMAQTIERAKAEDPRELRAEVARLHASLKKAQQPATLQKVVEKVQVPVLKDMQIQRLETLVGKITDEAERHGKALSLFWDKKNKATTALAGAMKLLIEAGKSSPPVIPRHDVSPRVRIDAHPPRSVQMVLPQKTVGDGSTELTGPEQRILDALAWLEGVGQREAEKIPVAFLAGYRANGGAFNNPRAALRGKGLIEYRGSLLALTEQGRALANAPTAVLTSGELHDRVMDRMGGPERKLLAVLLRAYPKSLTMDELAEATGYERNGGAFNNPRSRLRSLGLADYPEPGRVKASDNLFLDS